MADNGTPNDSVKRSVSKAFSWRIIGSLDTFFLSFFVISFLPEWMTESSIESTTDIAKAAGLIAITEIITKLILFTLHEQAWARIGWGIHRGEGRLNEYKIRSVVKTASWRVIAFADTCLLVWLFTGDVTTALSVGVLEIITKLFLYYGHERVWNRFR